MRSKNIIKDLQENLLENDLIPT